MMQPERNISKKENSETVDRELTEKEKKARIGQELGTMFLNTMRATGENQVVYESDPSVAKNETMKMGFLDYSREALNEDRPKKIQITFSKEIDNPEDPKVKKAFDTKVLMIYLNKRGEIDEDEPFMMKDLERKYVEDVNYKERLEEGRVAEGAPQEVKFEDGSWKEPTISDIKALLYPYRKDILSEKAKQKKASGF